MVMMISKTTLVMSVSAVLKRRDTILSEDFHNITDKHKIEMWNDPIFCPTEILPLDATFRVVKSSCFLWG